MFFTVRNCHPERSEGSVPQIAFRAAHVFHLCIHLRRLPRSGYFRTKNSFINVYYADEGAVTK